MTETDRPWFLREPPEVDDPPLPRADRRPLFDARDWLRAEAGAGRALAEAAAAFARLDERVLAEGQGERLALMETAGLMRAEGARVPAERIALYAALRVSAVADDPGELATAAWAARALAGGPSPEEDLRGFLGRRRIAAAAGAGERPSGAELDARAAEWRAALAPLAEAHPLTRAAATFRAWRLWELSGPGGAAEAGAAAARIGAGAAEGLRFAPLTLGAGSLPPAAPDVRERLEAWLIGTAAACRRALVEAKRVSAWRARAAEATAGLSGRTPGRLIAALAATPALSAEMAAASCGVSRAAALRNLALFERMGLAREITGQARFRFWTAAG